MERSILRGGSEIVLRYRQVRPAWALAKAAWWLRMVLPVPGNPLTTTVEYRGMPPPRTASNWSLPVLSLLSGPESRSIAIMAGPLLCGARPRGSGGRTRSSPWPVRRDSSAADHHPPGVVQPPRAQVQASRQGPLGLSKLLLAARAQAHR